jgi:hypothetical protein
MLALGLAGGAASAFLMARHRRASQRTQPVAGAAWSAPHRSEGARQPLPVPVDAAEPYEAFESPYEAFDEIGVDATVGPRPEPARVAEEYEPVPTEDLGREWLARATEAPETLDSRFAGEPVPGVAAAASASEAAPESDGLSELWDAPAADDDPAPR